MANDAEFTSFDKLSIIDFTEKLERFAALVAERERKEICFIFSNDRNATEKLNPGIDWCLMRIRERN